MKNNRYRKYLYLGITALIVIILSVCFIFSIMRTARVRELINLITDIVAPVIYGAVMAYLMNPVYNRVKRWVDRGLRGFLKNDLLRGRIAAVIATLFSTVFLCVLVTGLIALMIPELIDSTISIAESLPSSILNFQNWLAQTLSGQPELEEQVLTLFSRGVSYAQETLQTEILPNVYSIAGKLSTGVINVMVVIKNLVIGVIVMVYLLNIKGKLVTQAKMILYSLLPLRIANKTLDEFRYINQMFGGFIIGKLVDSLIIGILCFFLLSFMNMPFSLLVSVVIGCTNVIPFFGPFIGAIPMSFLILLVSPVKCLYFIVFIFLLQIFDGYILGPRILGGSTGVSSFWVLFSILFFGGLFGFVGMIIAVPTFAVIYKLFTELVVYYLHKKGLSCDINDYEGLSYIDSTDKSYQKDKRKL
ncbi:MAG: AI-2E family transporter [Clostridiales bacterium]|nr:AI-2E family transporter [Clostridiales bacterium]